MSSHDTCDDTMILSFQARLEANLVKHTLCETSLPGEREVNNSSNNF